MRPDDIDELRRAIDMADEETLRLLSSAGVRPGPTLNCVTW
jgi:hypothetical protein